MGSKTSIEWTKGQDGSDGATWTPIRARNIKTGKIGWHCEHATTGCEFCYAEGMNKRLGTGLPFKPGHRKDIEIFLDDKMLQTPLRWKRPRNIFVCSMTDLFAEFVQDEWIDRMFAVMVLCPQHTFQVLTKRAERMRKYLCDFGYPRRRAKKMMEFCTAVPASYGPVFVDEMTAASGPLPNVWLGVSAERQQEADERIPLLLQTPAAVRFVSLEPLLGPINLRDITKAPHVSIDALQIGRLSPPLSWVIVGGESGPHARPMNPQWARQLRDDCATAGVPFFFKQFGEWAPTASVGFGDTPKAATHTFETGKAITTFGSPVPLGIEVRRIGKKVAGRMLDGREHNDMPVQK